ncbi:MAG: hypothetical protein ACI88A_004516 [Paraglaciecola sp.]|jgi:hypothetical protein
MFKARYFPLSVDNRLAKKLPRFIEVRGNCSQFRLIAGNEQCNTG